MGTVCVLKNITEQKRLERALQQFQEFSRHSRDAFLVLRPDGRILDVNKAALALYGYSREEILQKNMQELFAGGTDPGQDGTTAFLKDCGGFFQQGEQRRTDGTSFLVEICSRSSFLGGAEVFLSMVRDLSIHNLAAKNGEPGIGPQKSHECSSPVPCTERKSVDTVQLFPSKMGDRAILVEMGEMASYHPSLHQIFQLLPQIAASQSTVLIQGETGTGKELLARTLHRLSSRAGQPFIAVNCSAIPDALLESELFGYRSGAFTGALKDKPGRFALAENGAIFLDEIGDMSPVLQAKLLRVLQQKTFEPLGSTTSEKTSARILVATHRDLTAMVQAGTFRADLYYRINVLKIDLPPLRDRREDIPLLVDHFVAQFNRETGREIRGIGRKAMIALMGFDFPGNIRELENIVERAFVLCTGDHIDIQHLPENLIRPARQNHPAERIVADLKSLEAQAILESLERNHFNRLATARELGIHKSTLFRKLKDLGIQLPPSDGRSRKD
jgi:PAS domain S-box-containing protein